MNKQPTFNLTNLLQRDRIESKLNSGKVEHVAIDPISALAPTASSNPAPSYFLEKQLNQFIEDVVQELLKNADQLCKLNPSRRESIGRFLAELSKQPEPENPQETLKEFIAHDRPPQALEALKHLFRQIAMVQLGKALLIKSWTREKFLLSDLKNLTSSINKAMGSFVNLQTSTSQLIQQNFYSWYNLTGSHQDQLWSLIESATSDDPTLEKIKEWMFSRARRISADTLGERDRYSKQFYQSLWKSMQGSQLIRQNDRTMFGFCPTLRDGSMMDYSPSNIEWIGFEPLSFELLFCEIRFLWGEPKSLPLWIRGSSLEMSMEHQSSLQLTHCGKQNTIQQIEAISSCEISIIAEENPIRTQSRTMAGQALRKQIDQHSVLKRVKDPNTTRGIYQACQSLDKLRQGGVLIWAREEVLDESSGKQALQFILNQAKLLFIADLSAIQCAHESIKRDLPKALYLFQRENDLAVKKGHRPIMIKTYGTITGPADVQLLFDRIFSLLKKPDQSFPHEPFQIHSRISPIEQREWEQHWFNPADDEMVDQIESLKRSSTPLGELAIIRMVSWAELYKNFSNQLPGNPMISSPPRFFLWAESGNRGNEIHTAEESEIMNDLNRKGHVFIVYPQDGAWTVPLQSLIRSHLTRDWLDYSAERKKGNWVLKESDVKSIPIPKHICRYLKGSHLETAMIPMSSFEERLISLVPTKPGEALTLLESKKQESIGLKSKVFVLASQVLHQQRKEQATLFSMVTEDGQIRQSVLEKYVLQDHDLCRIDQHPLIRFTPTMPEHQAITSVTTVQQPSPGILLATSKGLTQFLHIQDSWIREQVLDKLILMRTQIAEPTWREICIDIRIPKNPEQTKIVSVQIIKAFHAEKMRKKELKHLLSACLIEDAENITTNRMGLLQ
jgi:hypothetical protein